MQAEVRAATQLFDATLVAISPEIVDNQVTGRVRFNQSVPEGLRQNQRLTTRILLEEKLDVLIVQRGQFFDSLGVIGARPLADLPVELCDALFVDGNQDDLGPGRFRPAHPEPKIVGHVLQG